MILIDDYTINVSHGHCCLMQIYEVNIKAAAMLTTLSVPHMEARGLEQLTQY